MSTQEDLASDFDPLPGIEGKVSTRALPRKFRIMHVLFSSKIAGSERYCIDLANEQAMLGHEVHVAGTSGSPMAALLSRNVTFHGLRTPFLRGARLRRLVASAGIEFCHGHLSPACKALSCVPGDVVKVATLHVGFKARQHGRLDGVICVNSAQLARLGDYTGQARLVSNWLPKTRRGGSFDLRSRLGLPSGTRLVGSVGRLHPSKGYDVLISAFRRSAPEDAALVIIGEGQHRSVLEKLRAGDKRIHLLGHSDDVAGFLHNLDIFVSPSREESFGLAILEAMQEGLPIIATATEGPAEYLRSYPVTLVEPGSADRLAEALSDAFQANPIAGACRIDYDLSAFSQSTGVANILEFYSQVESRAADKVAAGLPRESVKYAF